MSAVFSGLKHVVIIIETQIQRSISYPGCNNCGGHAISDRGYAAARAL